MRKIGLSLKAREAISGYLFLFPWILGFFVFTAFPLFYSVFLSLNKVAITVDGIKTTSNGIGWYKEALFSDLKFKPALIDTSVFILASTPMIVIFSLIIAILLNNRFRGRAVFRAIFFFPVIIISGPVISELLTSDAAQIIIPAKYSVYQFIASLPAPVSMPIIYVFDNIVTILWFSGVQLLIYLAYLQKIGSSIYEAAQIDGASAWQMFWKIVLPFIKPVIFINSVYTIVQLSGFANNKVNEEIRVNLNAVSRTYSYSAAISWIYFLVILIMLGLSFLLLAPKKREGL